MEAEGKASRDGRRDRLSAALRRSPEKRCKASANIRLAVTAKLSVLTSVESLALLDAMGGTAGAWELPLPTESLEISFCISGWMPLL